MDGSKKNNVVFSVQIFLSITESQSELISEHEKMNAGIQDVVVTFAFWFFFQFRNTEYSAKVLALEFCLFISNSDTPSILLTPSLSVLCLVYHSDVMYMCLLIQMTRIIQIL